jgi:thiol-disulfide isomerase/thioredoxin
MGKATRIRQQNAREKIAAQRAAEKRAEQRRRLFITGGSVLAVIVIVVAFILVKSMSSPTTTPASTGRTPLPASVASNVTGVPASALAAVGKGSVITTSPPVTKVTGPPLTSNGKPEMLYIGAEYCPYCAAMRWSMAVALSRFGTLSTPLHGIHSASNDAFPNTATLTFYKSGYNSKHLTFTPVENLAVDHSLLQSPTAQQNQIWARYEPDPNQRGYPFIDIGNRYVIKGPIFDPGVLKGLTWSQIAADLHNPSSPVAQGVLGAANYITAAICKTTNNQPTSVCSAPSITAVAGGL